MSEVSIERKKTPPSAPQIVEKPSIKVKESKKPSLKAVMSQKLEQNPFILETTEKSQPIDEMIVPPVEPEVQLVVETVKEAVPESLQTESKYINESVIPHFIENLQETINSLKSALVEQQDNQTQLVHVIESLVQSIQQQNSLTESRFNNINKVILQTTNMLNETAEKLQSLAIREINIPAPIVNVSLSEQKRVTKTVDRDTNGLITKITEDIEQSVSQDK
jgi:transcription initiation factor TFIID subunit TAF12